MLEAKQMVQAKQTGEGIVTQDALVIPRATLDRIPFSADWKLALAMAGLVHQIQIGALADAAVTALIQGGGVGTTTDLDQPEFGVSVAAGWTLIPLEIDISCSADLDANDEIAEALVMADLAAAWVGDGTVTTETPNNWLTGAPSGTGCPARCFSACSADITDPTCSRILAHELVREMAVTDTTAGVPVRLHLHYEPLVPPLMKGPTAFYGYWGGTTRVDGVASVVFAVVPSDRFPLPL